MDKLPQYAEVSAIGQNGERFRTKAALKRALADAPGFIDWIVVGTPATGFEDRRLTTPQLVEAIDQSANLTGPDPSTDRRYYGTVTVKDDRLVIK
jgi:hypothetical protein